MSIAIVKYLDLAMIFANRNEGEARDVRVKLEDHFYKKVADSRRRVCRTAACGATQR